MKIAAALCVGLVAGVYVPANSPSILYQGRSLANADGTRSFDWEGWQAEFTLNSASWVNMTMSLPVGVAGRFRVFVDGDGDAFPEVPVSSNGTFSLAAGLDASKPHNVRIYNVAEPGKTGTWRGPFTFAGFASDGVPTSSQPRTRGIEFVGDSITAGSGCIGVAPCVEMLNTTDHAKSYGAVLCETFNANCSFVAWSGKGMYENCCDNPPFSGERMPSYWHQTLGGAAYVFDWQPQAFVPSAMLINLGTNDFGHGHDTGPAWEANFTATYLQFVQNVTLAYNNKALPIFAGVGAITNDYGTVVKNIVSQANAQGYNLTYVEMMGCGNGPCHGCNGHPNVTEHAAMAAIAQPIMAKVLGW